MPISTIGQNGLQQSRILTTVQQPAGAVLQVVQVFKIDVFTTTSASYVDVTGLSVSITPTSASSKILVIASINGGSSQDDVMLNMVRGSTSIGYGTTGTSNNGFGQWNGNVPVKYQTSFTGFVYLDSPATTTSTTYKLQICAQGGTSTAKINNRGNDGGYGTSSSITVMEIAA